jgi:hypothetical protein
MTTATTPAADTALSECLRAGLARRQELALLREAFAGGRDLSAVDTFRLRLRLTASALEIPEAEIAPFLNVHSRMFNSGRWIMTKLGPFAETHGINLDWLLVGAVDCLLREVRHHRRTGARQE